MTSLTGSCDTHVRADSSGFTLNVRFVSQLGFLEVFSFFCEGLGAALYIVGILSGMPKIAITGLGILSIAIAALILHLGKPTRLWRASANLKSAWVSRGALIMTILLAVGSISIMQQHPENAVQRVNVWESLSMSLAVLVILYSGLLLQSFRVIRLWNSILLPLSFFSQSISSGLCAYAAIDSVSGRTNSDLARISSEWMIGAIGISALMAALHLLTLKRTPGVRASLSKIIKGCSRWDFFLIALGVGIVAPTLLIITLNIQLQSASERLIQFLFVAIAICRLLGDYYYRSVIVSSGAYESPLFQETSN